MLRGLYPASFSAGPSPRQGKLFFLASQYSRNPWLILIKTSMAGPTSVCSSECKAVYTGAPPTTSPDSSVSPTHACPVPTPQGHPHPRLWGCRAAPTFFYFSLHVANAPALSLLTSLDLLQLISFIPFCLYFPRAWEGTEGDNRVLTCKFQINVFSPKPPPPREKSVFDAISAS